jgi:hypothetical protein
MPDPTPKTLEAIRDEIKAALARNAYSKSVPLAAFYDGKRLELVEAIIESLKTIKTSP